MKRYVSEVLPRYVTHTQDMALDPGWTIGLWTLSDGTSPCICISPSAIVISSEAIPSIPFIAQRLRYNLTSVRSGELR